MDPLELIDVLKGGIGKCTVFVVWSSFVCHVADLIVDFEAELIGAGVTSVGAELFESFDVVGE